MDIRDSIEENLFLIEKITEKKWSPKNNATESTKEDEPQFDMLLLPELFTTGYHPKEVMRGLAEDINGETLAFLKKLAREKNINIGAGTFPEEDKGNIFNSSVAINSKGQLINIYRKTHLFGVMKEDKIFKPGNIIRTCENGGLICGTIICYEIRFPEIARKLALQGAKIIFCPAEWPHPKSTILYTLARARAIENQLFFIVINRVGKQRGFQFCGTSMVCAPDGTLLAVGKKDREEIIDVELDLDEVDRYRTEITSLKDRREKLYKN